MSGFLLDTNVLSEFRRRGQPDPDLPWASVLSFGEIPKGLERLLQVTNAIEERWGVLSAQALERGTPPPNVDGLIAATDTEQDLTLVTRKAKDFVSLGVAILNPWWASQTSATNPSTYNRTCSFE